MARPKKNSDEKPVEQRLEEAFWELVQEYSIEQISIGMLTTKAQCNRGTFYYYFHDIYHMVDVMIDKCLPQSIPLYLLPHIGSPLDATKLAEIIQGEQPGLDRLCTLLNSSSSPWILKKAKKEMRGLWLSALGIDVSALTEEAKVVFEFATNGLLGVMAYRAETGFRLQVEDVVRSLSSSIIEALVETLTRSTIGQCQQSEIVTSIQKPASRRGREEAGFC